MATDETERIQQRLPREVEELLRTITEREPDIESLWVRDSDDPRPWGTQIYSLVEKYGDIIEVRVRSYDVNREGWGRENRCILDKPAS